MTNSSFSESPRSELGSQHDTPSFSNDIVQSTLSAIHQLSESSMSEGEPSTGASVYPNLNLVTNEEQQKFSEFLNEHRLNTPSINEVSKKMKRQSKVEDILIETGKMYEVKKETMRTEFYANNFEPVINPESKMQERYESIEERLTKLEEARKEKLQYIRENQVAEEYSHSPSISKLAKNMNRKDVERISRDFIAQKEAKVQKIREEMQKEEIKEGSFSPMLNPRTLKLVNRIKARRRQGTESNLILEQREYERARKLAQQAEREPRLIEDVSPRITTQAAQLIRDGSISDRLYELSFKMSDMKDEKIQQREASIHNLYDYSPRTKQPMPLHIEEEEERIFRRKSDTVSPTRKFTAASVDSILSRSEALRLRKNAKMEEILERQKAMHHPKINPVSEEIAARLPETTMQRLLGASPKQYKPQLYPTEEYTFKPHINPKSKEIELEKRGIVPNDISSRIEAIYQREEKRKEKLKLMRQELEEKEVEGCTFSPNTGKSHQDPVFSRSFTQRVSLWERKKRAKVARERAAVVEREMRECTFSPSVKKSDSSVNVSKSSISISSNKNEPLGYDEFIQRQNIAREKKEQIIKGPWVTGENWRNAVTIPKEFSFNQRSEVKVKSLKKPASPADVRKSRSSVNVDDYEDYQGEYDYDGSSDGFDEEEIANDANFANPTEDTELDVPPQGLFSAKTSVSILERMPSNRIFDRVESPQAKERSKTALDVDYGSPYEEWLRRAQAKNLGTPSPTKWKEDLK